MALRPSTVIGQSFFTSRLKATFTLFPILPSFVSSRRLLTRRLGGWRGVRLRKIVHRPYLFGRDCRSETKFPYRFVHRSHRRKKFALRITRSFLNAHAWPGRLQPTKENDRPIASFDLGGEEVQGSDFPEYS